MNTDRKIGILVGILFLAAIATYGGGNGIVGNLLEDPDYLAEIADRSGRMILGSILMLLNSAVVVAIGILILPILERHNRYIAWGYQSTRIIESIILAFGVISLLSLITLGQEYLNAGSPANSPYTIMSAQAIKVNFLAYQIAMLFLGIGGVLFSFVLFQARLIPPFISILGVIGYASLFVGATLELFGLTLGLILSIPGGIFEILFPIWLFVRGFNQPAAQSSST